jgi:hypothetical protein
LSRRTPFKDDLIEEAHEERRRAPRAIAAVAASLGVGDLVVRGTITDVAPGGVFFATRVVIEVGERGTLLVDEHAVRVRVMWLRGNAHPSGPGMGLAFDDDPEAASRLHERLTG